MILLCKYIASTDIKTPKMCDEDFDDCLAALEFIHDWFVASKMLSLL